MSDVEISRNKQTDSNNQKLNTQIQHTALRKKGFMLSLSH